MIDRPDRDIETSAAGAARHRQGDGDRKNEVSLPYPSRPHRGLHLECGISNADPARAGEDFMAANADIFISMSWLIIDCARVDLALMLNNRWWDRKIPSADALKALELATRFSNVVLHLDQGRQGVVDRR
jgi:hypothetical protein